MTYFAVFGKMQFCQKNFRVNFYVAHAYNACNDGKIGGVMDRLLEPSCFSYGTMKTALMRLCAENEYFSFGTLAQSVLGHDIPTVTVGKGKKAVLFVGAHHGSEWMTAWLLLRFLFDLAARLRTDGTVGGVRQRVIFESRRLCVIPMLNPDGVLLSQTGVADDCILADRLVRMNGGSHDFTHWQANARGVDLNHNYDAGFFDYKRMEAELGIGGGCDSRYSGLYPESEPESRALANLARVLPLVFSVSLHSQGEEIFASSRAHDRARILCRLSDYRLSSPVGSAAFGGFTDYVGSVLSVPSVTVECGKGKNPLPTSMFVGVYLRLRRALFAAAAM